MPSIIIIEKNCNIKLLKLKSFVEEELYKKCNFKSGQGFTKKASWQVAHTSQPYTIDLYGKTEGRANHENKYEFPPPADNILFFGSCILVKRDTTGEVVDITTQEWEKYYLQFHDGFEDIDIETSSISSDEDMDDNIYLTKDGYVKDDFVVEDVALFPTKLKRGRKKSTTTDVEGAKSVRKPRKTAAVIAAEVNASIKNDTEDINNTTVSVSIYDEEPELSEEEYV